MTPLGPTLCEISDERKSLRPAVGRRGSANGSRAKNFLPPAPPFFARSPWPNRAKRGGKKAQINRQPL